MSMIVVMVIYTYKIINTSMMDIFSVIYVEHVL